MVRARPALHERPSVVQGQPQLNSWALGIYYSSGVLEKLAMSTVELRHVEDMIGC